MDRLGVNDSVERKFAMAVVLQYLSAIALLVIPFLVLGIEYSLTVYSTLQLAVVGALAVLATVAFLNTILVVRADVLDPIVEMRTTANAIANGRLDTPPPDREQSDELGELNGAFCEMYDYLSTVAEQARALRHEEFDDAAFEREVPGELGDGLAEMQTTLRERIHELRTFDEAIEQVGTGIAVYDGDGTLEYVNKAYAEMLDAEPEMLERTHVATLDPDVDAACFDDYWESFEEGETRRTETTRQPLEDGMEFPVAVTTTRVTANGDPHYVRTILDISERKEQERQLRELHEAARGLVEAEDREEVAELAADAARDILGYENTVVRFVTEIGKLQPMAMTDHARTKMGSRPDYPLEGENLPAKAFDSGEPLRFENVDDVEPDGGNWAFRSAMYLPIGDHGVLSITDSDPDAFEERDVKIASVLASNVEMGLNRLEREAEIRRQNERLERFGRTVAHDLRNPIHLIEGYLDPETLAENPEEAHEEIEQAANRMSELVDGLLELAKRGQSVIDPEPVSLEEIAWIAWSQVDTESMTLEVRDDADVFMDRSRVQQVFENLFRNAGEHAGPDARVVIGTIEGGFYVEDDGPGIPGELRDDVFDSGVTSDDDGTGFGLAIVKQIAEAHNWSISVTDGSTGGARFAFTNVGFESPDFER